jgi:putative copper resistance protein D
MTVTSCPAASSFGFVNPDLLSVLTRGLGFVSLFQAAGAAFFLALFGPWLAASGDSIRRLGCYAALAGLLLLAAHQWLEGARMADDYAGLADPSLQRLAWSGSGGNAALLQIIGLLAVALALARRRGPAVSVACIGALIAACAFALTGHTSEYPQRALLGPLLCLHLLLVAFWFGALLPLIICIRRETRSDAAALLHVFSAVAGWLVPCIGVAGLTMAIILLPSPMGWRAVYGRLLLLKLSLFCLLLLLAAWNRWRAVPAMAAKDLPAALAAAAPKALSRTIALEYLLVVAVFAITAVLTSFYSPKP